MAESNSKLSAPLQKFATDLKTVLQKTETQIRELRAREASTKDRKLEKHELCPLCGGPDVNGRCKCITTLQKNAQLGYGPGAQMGGAGGGGGGEPMAMNELCKNCGKKHDMDKCGLDEVTAGKDLSKDDTASVIAKASPPGKFKDLPEKLKEEGHSADSAFAIAWAAKNKADAKKSELAKMGMPSSSASALAPAAPKPATPVGQVNHEMGGFKSIAGGSPVAGGKLMPSTKMNVGTAGRRAGNVQAPVSGTINNAKSEMGAGDKRYGGPGHATQQNMPSALKDNMAPVAKGELKPVPSAPEGKRDGAKLPKKTKDVSVDKQGSGGEIKAGAKLSKSAAGAVAAPGKAPAGKGVPGKQPVGQGGGDAHKVAAAAKPAALPKPSTGNAVTKPVPGKLKAAGAAEVGRLKGNANVQRLKGDLANIQAARAKPAHPDTLASIASAKAAGNVAAADRANAANPESVDVDVSEFNQEGAPKTAGQRMAGAPAAAPAAGRADALNGVRDQMNAGAAQPRGGVNFLRGLFSMFHRPKPAPDASLNPAPQWQQQGQRTSARFNGAKPLQRSEKDMRKAALAMTKKDLDDAELDKGLSAINHNRRMFSVKPGSPKGRRAKKNR